MMIYKNNSRSYWTIQIDNYTWLLCSPGIIVEANKDQRDAFIRKYYYVKMQHSIMKDPEVYKAAKQRYLESLAKWRFNRQKPFFITYDEPDKQTEK
ncbi:Uncharacterised protein [Chryseobacterium taklimakanense]|uniref:Uncharacterized protein n=1 Tax=Chryseobacterium taklimakanense TaxID=536441 RepID=A0A239XQ05_9FLAO|nr:hypothetical protein [Chryseobacterium taklimakanense]SNV48163.1 Uncharacterised protein [Chryseobacterium taklimakanense]